MQPSINKEEKETNRVNKICMYDTNRKKTAKNVGDLEVEKIGNLYNIFIS